MKELVIKSKRTRNALIGSGDDSGSGNKRESLPSVPTHLRSPKAQYELLRAVHYGLERKDSESVTLLARELSSKLNGYKQQDIKKKLYDANTFITLEQIRGKLIDDTIACVFCGVQVKLLYDEVRDDAQWTLDRVDNDKGHSDDNTRVACLKCNLQRRRLDYEKFHWTKNFTITKVDDGNA